MEALQDSFLSAVQIRGVEPSSLWFVSLQHEHRPYFFSGSCSKGHVGISPWKVFPKGHFCPHLTFPVLLLHTSGIASGSCSFPIP